MFRLSRLCSTLLFGTAAALIANARSEEPISFSIYSAKAPSQDEGAKKGIGFSIHDAPEELTEEKAEGMRFSIHEQQDQPTAERNITFSVYDAKEEEKKKEEEIGDKLACADIRSINRVLVFYHENQLTETVREYVCFGKTCGWQTRVVARSPKACVDFMKSLKKLPGAWEIGDGDCVHFKPINIEDPKNSALVKDLDVKTGDTPLLVKETDPTFRKKAAGMDGADAAHVYLRWYVRPEPEQTASAEKCLPVGPLDGIQFSAEQWTYPGNIRHHLTDPMFPHHLPKALVDSWSDAQCVGWHNWHHKVLRERSVKQAPQKAKVRQVSHGYPRGTSSAHVADRVSQIASSMIRRPPAQIVAGSHSSDPKSKKSGESTSRMERG